ncbi:MAG: AAA family ATPase [Peptococcaceae bacterium]
MRIEGLRVRNFKIFKDLHLTDLPDLVVILGANGSGKSTLFDVFGFLHDALIDNVRAALTKRGGYKEVISRDQDGPIEFEIKFRPEKEEPLVTYVLHIGLDEKGLPVVAKEVLKYRRGQKGKPWHFLDFSFGSGTAIINESEYGRQGVQEQREEQKLDSPDILAIKGLGQFQKFKQVAAFRRFIEGWHVSDFRVQAARASQDAGYAEHLSTTGENLPLVAQFMYEHYPDRFNKVLRKMEQRVPGVTSVKAAETEDGRIVLKFQDGSFKDPFVARYVSDGTIKMFAYLLLLNDPKPHPILCIEEPESQLHPQLLFELAEEFKNYAQFGGQVFITTHSPDFVNGVNLEGLFWLTKENGFSIIRRASQYELLRNLVAEGDLPGYLWKQGLFEGAGPR